MNLNIRDFSISVDRFYERFNREIEGETSNLNLFWRSLAVQHFGGKYLEQLESLRSDVNARIGQLKVSIDDLAEKIKKVKTQNEKVALEQEQGRLSLHYTEAQNALPRIELAIRFVQGQMDKSQIICPQWLREFILDVVGA